MSASLTAPLPLVVDLLRWVANRERTNREAMDAWRTPRLPVCEDALSSGFVVVTREAGHELTVAITPEGKAFLDMHSP
jgi:hypothetical protein